MSDVHRHCERSEAISPGEQIASRAAQEGRIAMTERAISPLLSRRMAGLDPYKPGEQPHDREYIKLNANENPYPPCPEVVQEVADYITSHPQAASRYADPDSTVLRGEIARMLTATGGVLSRVTEGAAHISPDMVYCGNGSDEVLSLSYYAFFDDAVVSPQHSYSFYPVYCGYYGVRQEKVPLKDDWSLDCERMAEAARRLHAPTILANPNAPTGVSLPRGGVEWMLDNCPQDKVFLADEAYVDFGGESALPLLARHPNLVIVRTFSKSMCAAGMRLGYLVANKPLVDAITTVKNSMNHFPVDAVAQVFGAASCRHYRYYAEKASEIASEREGFSSFLAEYGYFVIPSRTNFVFTRKDGVPGESAYRAIKAAGILVRHFDTPGIEDYLRITIGTHQEMAALQEVMDRI